MSSDRKDKIGLFMDLFDGAKEFYEDNQEMFNELSGGSDAINLQEMEPLMDVQKSEDKIKVSVETAADSLTELGFEYDPQRHTLIVKTGGEPIEIILTDDAVVDNIDAGMKNGVVTVTVPRASPTDSQTEESDGGDD